MDTTRLVELINRPRIHEFITTLGGHNSVELLGEMFLERRGAVDDVFADKLSLKVTEVRTLLNRLHYRGLVEYTRTRDEDSGWYTYKWFVKPGTVLDLLDEKLQEEISNSKEQLSIDENYLMFSCLNKCNTVPFEIAAEYGFRCPDCAEEMQTLDSEVEASKRKGHISNLQAESDAIKTLLSEQVSE